MTAEYTTNFEDFKAAQRLAMQNSRPWLKARFLLLQRVLPASGILSICLLTWLFLSHHLEAAEDVAPILVTLAFLGAYLPFMRARAIRRLYSRMKNGRSEQDPLILTLSDEELILRIPGRGESRLLPNSFLKFAENDEVCLLYYSRFNFLLFPKRTLAPLQIEELKQWIKSRSEIIV
jgi:hypothetical protein